MGQNLKELRDTILADITKDYLDSASDEFLSETELAGLDRDGDIYFTEQGLASFDYSPNLLP